LEKLSGRGNPRPDVLLAEKVAWSWPEGRLALRIAPKLSRRTHGEPCDSPDSRSDEIGEDE